MVVTRLDHDANVRPWVQAAAGAGRHGALGRRPAARGRPADRPAGRADLGTDQAGRGDRGQQRDRHPAGRGGHHRPGPRGRGAQLRGRGARHPARPGRRRASSAPTSTSPAPTSGPGRTWARWSRIPGCSTRWPRTSWCPRRSSVPDRFEHGTLPFADLAGVTAAVEHLASLAGPVKGEGGWGGGGVRAGGSGSWRAWRRRRRTSRAVPGAARRPGRHDHVTTYGKAARRTATAYFNVAGRTPLQVAGTWPRRRSTCGTATTTPGS